MNKEFAFFIISLVPVIPSITSYKYFDNDMKKNQWLETTIIICCAKERTTIKSPDIKDIAV